MKAIVLETPGHLHMAEIDAPQNPGPGEALIRIHRAGVCGTDLHAYQGEQPFFAYPRILGHELGVEVLALGAPEAQLQVGDRCALEPYFYCGQCSACRRGRTNCCLHLRVFGVHIDGGLRTTAIVPARNLHPSPTLSYDYLALVEPLCIGAHAVARAQLIPGERVLVVGAGPIGLAVIQSALLEGTTPLVMDISPRRLAFVRRQWPEMVCLEPGDDPVAKLRDRMGGDLPTAVFDATGNPQSMEAAFAYVDHEARLIFVGLHQGTVTFRDQDFHRRETTLFSSRNATAADFRRIIAAIESGHINLSHWITHRAPFERMSTEFPAWFDRESGVIKAMVSLS
jgi:2-desacetyl-2-hydroxyethyl bacteriochlorophyllide A dehydrogenase